MVNRGVILNPFSPDSKCVKCGHDEATSNWNPGSRKPDGELLPDRIIRNCKRCGWNWQEAPLDQSPSPTVGKGCIKCWDEPDDFECDLCSTWPNENTPSPTEEEIKCSFESTKGNSLCNLPSIYGGNLCDDHAKLKCSVCENKGRNVKFKCISHEMYLCKECICSECDFPSYSRHHKGLPMDGEREHDDDPPTVDWFLSDKLCSKCNHPGKHHMLTEKGCDNIVDDERCGCKGEDGCEFCRDGKIKDKTGWKWWIKRKRIHVDLGRDSLDIAIDFCCWCGKKLEAE